jgi:hypothetical protein
MPWVNTKTEEPYPRAWAAGIFDETPLEVHEVRLRGADKDLRGRTAYRLRDKGAAAVPALCEALKDPDLAVRAAAAESLAEIGDARAIGPLSEALKTCFDTGSARKQRWIGILVLAVIVVVFATLFYGVIALKIAGAMGGSWYWIARGMTAYYRRLRQRGPQITAFANALDRIASREPSPELRALLPELEAVAGDPLLHTATTRAATREVADRIAALTERIKSMPVAAAAPEVDADHLPIAAGSR